MKSRRATGTTKSKPKYNNLPSAAPCGGTISNHMKAIVSPCTCHHASQDSLHGKGNRVKNPRAKKTGQEQQYRCTVCGVIGNK